MEDGYTHRTDEIIGDEENHAKIVDDSILWNDDIRANFFKTCEFIRKCTQSGIIFNPKKFQFALKTVKFAGFEITETGVRPPAQGIS